jgi:hypothetical protein
MAGRPLSRLRADAEAERIRLATALPTEPRQAPATYTPDLDLEIIALADKGLMPAEIAAHWAISEQGLKEWEEAHPSFNDAARRARTRAKAWWQRQPRLAIAEGNNKFPAGAWAQQVRAMFPEYDDKTTINVTLDLSRLVMLDLTAGELPIKQTGGEPKLLIEHAPTQLAVGQTLEETLG